MLKYIVLRVGVNTLNKQYNTVRRKKQGERVLPSMAPTTATVKHPVRKC